MTVDLKKYSHFVDTLTSETSKNLDLYVQRMQILQSAGINPVLFNTAVTGLAGEAGEFAEINKKLNWHGKPLDDEKLAHLKKELGDIIFYWMMACHSLNADPEEIIQANVEKLQARYPDGEFSVERSENRREDDV